MLKITSLRHAYPEPKGLTINRPFGLDEYTFLHFFQSVEIMYEGRSVTTKPGAVIIYDKATPQFFKTSQPLIHNWIHFKGNINKAFEKYGLSFNKIYYPEDSFFITELVYELETEFYLNRSNKEELLKLKFCELLIKLSRSINSESIPTVSPDIKQKLQHVRMKMFSNLSEHMSVGDMAKEVNLSQSRFHNLYKLIYGISPVNDLINARVEKAKQMLFLEHKTVREISEALGYENYSHFIRQFKSITNYSPTEYKRLRKTDSLQ